MNYDIYNISCRTWFFWLCTHVLFLIDHWTLTFMVYAKEFNFKLIKVSILSYLILEFNWQAGSEAWYIIYQTLANNECNIKCGTISFEGIPLL